MGLILSGSTNFYRSLLQIKSITKNNVGRVFLFFVIRLNSFKTFFIPDIYKDKSKSMSFIN